MSASAEIRRLRYLAAMGVPVYVTRRTLPGAAATSKLALRRVPEPTDIFSTATANDTAAAGPADTTSLRTPPAAQALRESLRQDARQDTSSTPTASVAGAPGARPLTGESDAPLVRFHVVAIVFAQRLWVEELGDTALASEQLQLILAMGRALMHPGESSTQPGVTEFRWPMHDNVQLGLGADEAAATLQGFLQRQLDDNACVEMICLGEPARLLLGNLSVPCARRYVPATRQVIESPLLKRDIWAALNN